MSKRVSADRGVPQDRAVSRARSAPEQRNRRRHAQEAPSRLPDDKRVRPAVPIPNPGARQNQDGERRSAEADRSARRRSSIRCTTPASWSNCDRPDLHVHRRQARRAARPAGLPRRQCRDPGEIAPRGFPPVLSKGDRQTFTNGSGRLELGEKIFTDAAPLAARVIVNRVWAWHFGKPLVATPSDFGTQGEQADSSGAARRSGRALHRQRLVAQVAASRDHALGHLSPGEPAARGRRWRSIPTNRCCGA